MMAYAQETQEGAYSHNLQGWACTAVVGGLGLECSESKEWSEWLKCNPVRSGAL